MMMGWGFALFMICVVLMAWMMMGHGRMGHGWDRHRHGEDGEEDAPERTLANRLASGEIDTDEYERLLATIRRSDGSTR
jgi:uncharacterized membrane protein